jgi:hypothetical protein
MALQHGKGRKKKKAFGLARKDPEGPLRGSLGRKEKEKVETLLPTVWRNGLDRFWVFRSNGVGEMERRARWS